MKANYSVLAFASVLLCGLSAHAQQQSLATREWGMLPAGLRTCVDNQLRQEQGTNLEALIAAGIRPSDPKLVTIKEFCLSPAGEASVTRPSFGGPDRSAVEFAEWMNATILAKPVFARAFAQCREVVGLYQDKVLGRLQAAEAGAVSKSDQLRIRTIKDDLSSKRGAAATVACTKQFVASLAIANASSGFYADQLGALNGRLLNNGIKLKEAAASRVDDMTDQGLAQLAIKIGLENFQAQELQADIDSVGQYGSGSGPLTCLLPAEWVGVEPGGYSPCHGSYLERKVAEISSLLKIR
ncbi:hypothetical protein [Bradyrhizobium japonicum]|uniref:hypothetical protein n=1 Tax=Bradyrhizobium japonicum TaxID=375 RepID=UPI001E5848E2|nr:hypothetical protein [Bradyrhizobium japonicum]MCD9816657.1 hypothetical protein [Bradyrhizobium japonicum]MEB2670318.1 hypothetical protein [Bradyrhizobium japonicum]WRI89669.1 hypothetical protein R3F75_01530 [Bradyrhizobium japonicum]